MKKFAALLLALVMALSLVACGEKKDDTNEGGDTATGSLMAGQVAGMLHEVRPVADILDELWESGRQRMHSLSELC